MEQLDESISARINRLAGGGRPAWNRRPDVVPWLDRKSAAEVAKSVKDEGNRALLEQWVQDGYVVIDDAVLPADIDTLSAAMDDVWRSGPARKGLTVRDLRVAPGAPLDNMTHAELLRLDASKRREVQGASRWRIHEFEAAHPAALRIFANNRLRQLASLILGRPSRPVASITFMYGSEQALHQDMAVFHVWPRNHILGAWIACDDISAGSGPLMFYPGSHREPMFTEFDRYPVTNLHTADDARVERYQQWIDVLAQRYERKEFLARKGQVLLWHSMLFHGGSPVTEPAATRRSYVIHYAPRGALQQAEWEGARW